MYGDGKVIAISYGNEKYTMSLKLNLFTAKIIGGADATMMYTPKDIEDNKYSINKQILEMDRGAGYWIWKPYILLKTLDLLELGDYVIYTDAGLIYTDKIRKLIEVMENDNQSLFLSSGFAPNGDWCKRDAFIMMDCDVREAYEKTQISGGYVLVRKTIDSTNFIRQWLEYVNIAEIVTDIDNVCGYDNLPGFREHRHDQAILTNLAYKWGIDGYKGVTHVDEPRAHIKALHGIFGAYGYSFEERIELIKKKHREENYKKSKYGRMFINTKITNCNIFYFLIKLLWRIVYTLYVDLWGNLFDRKYLE